MTKRAPIKKRTSANKKVPTKPTKPPIKAAPSGIVSILAVFDCDHSVFDREAFQKEGHFVPGLYGADRRTPRQWKGTELHELKLWRRLPPPEYKSDARGEPVQQVLRVLSDSLESAVASMEALIPEAFFSVHHAQQMQASTFQMMSEMQAKQEELLKIVKEVGGARYQDNDNAVAAACQLIRELGEKR